MTERREVLKQRLDRLYQEIGEVTLVAVTKAATIEDIKICYDLGHRDFGENRIQQLKERADELLESCPEIRWHMIGNIQTNKVNHLLKVPNLYFVHSVSSEKILDLFLNKELTRGIGFFLQVNTSGESEKSGFLDEDEIKKALEKINLIQNKNFQLKGLMTIGAIRTENFEQDAKLCFEKLVSIKNSLSLSNIQLSMGMSQDYQLAVKMGANYVRIGSSIFKKSER